ncbi:MAG TPA: AbrB/MazE/SpoVT family DNA-binding domain-containing protein [Methanoregula sp.]|nr:AbrB/MazE/SpoVT family DNA-binding domain-containing protein [Methanoregula sp.]
MTGMAKKPDNAQKSACSPAKCQVEAVLPVDRRGQIVIPKEVRKRANIRDGDKLALVSWMNKDEICCLALIRTDNLSSEISGVMHSLLADKD